MSDKHSILGDTSLAAQEGKRLIDLIDQGDIAIQKLLESRINQRVVDIGMQITFVVNQMAELNAELKTYYTTAHKLRSKASIAKAEYETANSQTNIAYINEKYDTYLQLYKEAEFEFELVNSLPVIQSIQDRLRELHNQYEELILLLGSMLYPADITES